MKSFVPRLFACLLLFCCTGGALADRLDDVCGVAYSTLSMTVPDLKRRLGSIDHEIVEPNRRQRDKSAVGGEWHDVYFANGSLLTWLETSEEPSKQVVQRVVIQSPTVPVLFGLVVGSPAEAISRRLGKPDVINADSIVYSCDMFEVKFVILNRVVSSIVWSSSIN